MIFSHSSVPLFPTTHSFVCCRLLRRTLRIFFYTFLVFLTLLIYLSPLPSYSVFFFVACRMCLFVSALAFTIFVVIFLFFFVVFGCVPWFPERSRSSQFLVVIRFKLHSYTQTKRNDATTSRAFIVAMMSHSKFCSFHLSSPQPHTLLHIRASVIIRLPEHLLLLFARDIFQSEQTKEREKEEGKYDSFVVSIRCSHWIIFCVSLLCDRFVFIAFFLFRVFFFSLLARLSFIPFARCTTTPINIKVNSRERLNNAFRATSNKLRTEENVITISLSRAPSLSRQFRNSNQRQHFLFLVSNQRRKMFFCANKNTTKTTSATMAKKKSGKT